MRWRSSSRAADWRALRRRVSPVFLQSRVGVCAYGAALVSSRIFLFFKSCGSGRCWRCFSSESRRSRLEVGAESILGAWDGSAMIVYMSCLWVVACSGSL